MSESNVPVAVIYQRAYDLFQDKSRWAQGYYNFDREGKTCPWAEGYSFCALGAMVYFGNGISHAARCCLQRISEHLYGESIQKVNDEFPDAYEKVLAALKFGIAFWSEREPTTEELGMSVSQIMEKRYG